MLVTARQFPALGVVGLETKELPELLPVESIPRLPQAPELVEPHVLELVEPEFDEGSDAAWS